MTDSNKVPEYGSLALAGYICIGLGLLMSAISLFGLIVSFQVSSDSVAPVYIVMIVPFIILLSASVLLSAFGILLFAIRDIAKNTYRIAWHSPQINVKQT